MTKLIMILFLALPLLASSCNNSHQNKIPGWECKRMDKSTTRCYDAETGVYCYINHPSGSWGLQEMKCFPRKADND